jgi:hypothetical protein
MLLLQDPCFKKFLTELQGYWCCWLQVGLTVLQYLVWVVQSNVLRSYTGMAGPAEVLLARRLMDITKAVSNADATGEACAAGPLEVDC